MKIWKLTAMTLTLASTLAVVQAQTVTYTEGTSDGSKSVTTADGSSVAADINMGFKISKKLAISVHDGSSVSNDPMFNGLDTTLTASSLFFDYNENADSTDPTLTEQGFDINGLFYTNAEGVSFAVTAPAKFIHEDGSAAGEADVASCEQRVGINAAIACGSNIINSSDYNAENGAGNFEIDIRLLKATLTNVDRAGIYNATLSIVATLP